MVRNMGTLKGEMTRTTPLGSATSRGFMANQFMPKGAFCGLTHFSTLS